MRKVIFPPVDTATEDGLVAIGGDLEIDTLKEAYHQGIFPWPISIEFPLAWFSPDPRGVLDFSQLHVSRSFEKFLRKDSGFNVTFNQNFSGVIKNCATVYRKDQRDTWITPDIIEGYEKLFKASLAYSVEVWLEQELVGGLYGVCMGNFISGESMFMKKDGASKVALYTLVKKLESRKILWMDTQMVTPAVKQFGGKYIPRKEFIQRIQSLNWERERKEVFD